MVNRVSNTVSVIATADNTVVGTPIPVGSSPIGVAITPALVLKVAIDIKPGSDPNCFNNDGHGVIPVAILGSGTLDVNDVDISTLELDGQAVAVRGRNKIMCHIEDTDGDGLDDLVCQIEDEDGTYAQGDGIGTLTGALNDEAETPIMGTDSICVTQ